MFDTDWARLGQDIIPEHVDVYSTGGPLTIVKEITAETIVSAVLLYLYQEGALL